jgi:hypothetical protein
MVCVLPLPVCPYTKMVPLNPLKRSSERERCGKKDVRICSFDHLGRAVGGGCTFDHWPCGVIVDLGLARYRSPDLVKVKAVVALALKRRGFVGGVVEVNTRRERSK